VPPAQQCLGTHHLLVHHLGLVIQIELALLDRVAQIGFHLRTGADRGLHAGVEEVQRVAPGTLGLVHRQVCPLEQLFHRLAGAMERGGPHADGDVARRSTQDERLAQRFHHAAPQFFGLLGGLQRIGRQILQHHGKFVPALAGQV
jgi:hypothetical protein